MALPVALARTSTVSCSFAGRPPAFEKEQAIGLAPTHMTSGRSSGTAAPSAGTSPPAPPFLQPTQEHQEGRGTAMSSRQPPTGDFDTELTQLLPRLRAYALSLTRDSVR